MSDRNKPSPIPASDTQAVENQMRRALGLQGSGRPVVQQRPDQARARHKFVQDGGVPVVMLNRSEDATAPFKARISELEASLDAEKGAHAATRRALHDAQLASQALQTRLTHAELAHSDFLTTERQAREAAEAARQEAIQQLAVTQAKQVRRKTTPVPAAEKEAQPVKWWLPNYRAKNN